MIADHVASRDGIILIPPEKRNIGYVFQDLALWPHMTAFQNVEFALKAAGVPKAKRIERVRSMLALIEIPALAERRPSQLSGGEQQRVAIARALVTNPSAVLMDEPFSSLDDALRQSLGERLIELQAKLGFTLIYVTHHADEAQRLHARVILLH